MLHTLPSLHSALTRNKNGQSLGTFRKHCSFGNKEALEIKEIVKLVVKKTGLKWARIAFHYRTFVIKLKYLAVGFLFRS
jgi:hypothetical protein